MSEKILVVDDDKSVLKTIERVLKSEGYAVTTINSSIDALDKIKKEFFTLIVMDVRMPKMDGISLLREVRRVQEGGDSSRVIILTGFASEETPIHALKLGADDYIMKPFELDDFLHSVNKNIELSRLENERREYVNKLEKLQTTYKDLLEDISDAVLPKKN